MSVGSQKHEIFQPEKKSHNYQNVWDLQPWLASQLELEQVFLSEHWTTMNKAKMWSDTLLPLHIQPLETDIVDILCSTWASL